LKILRPLVISGLSLMLLLQPLKNVMAQQEEEFVKRTVISKTDALVLSAVFPGLGQMTVGQKYKGMSLFLAETISLILAVNANENYNTKLKVYKRDLNIFNSMNERGNYTDALSSYKDLKTRNDELNNLNSIRNTALIVAVGVYAYNIFDSLVFTPSATESKKAEGNENRIKVSSTMIDRNPGVLLSKSF
jgi:hypothetical protein